MSRALLSLSLCLCLACFSLSGETATVIQPVPLTVILDIKDRHYSANSLAAMKNEVQTILEGAGMLLDWRLKDKLPAHAEFTNLVVFTMTGSCRMDMTPMMIDERGPLAVTYTSDGAVLPFGEVRCDRVKASVQRASKSLNANIRDSAFGVALGRVMAHEIYHMIAEEKQHTSDGLTTSSLRADQLVSGTLKLNASALARIESRLHSTGQK